MQSNDDDSVDMDIGETPKLILEHEYPNVERYQNPKYSGEIHLKCHFHGINELRDSEIVVSATHYIRGLPFIIIVERKVKRSEPTFFNNNESKRPKLDIIVFKLMINDNNEENWKCKFSVIFNAINNPGIERQFNNKINATLRDTRKSLTHDMDFKYFNNLNKFSFKIDIFAELPTNWCSIDATGFLGLRNEGATCYINALLQSLFAIKKFRQIIYNAPVDPDDINHSFVFGLKYIFYLMESNRMPEVRTLKLIKHFNWEQMTYGNQQDIQEFSRRLIDALNEYLGGTEFMNCLSDMFVGQMQITTECLGTSSSHDEDIWDLQLSIQETSDIQTAFKAYLEPQEIKDYSVGYEKHDALQKRQFTSLPPVLYIHLMRFRYDSKTNQINKSNKTFKFDAELDLTEYLPNSSYTLQSVLVHSGNLNSGHYTAFINPNCDDNWFKFDDHIVTKCSAADAIEKNHGNRGDSSAYMLVYIKNVAIPDILRSIPDIPSLNLIEEEIQKEENKLNWLKDRYELIAFTGERMNNCKYKRGAGIFDVKNKGSYIRLYIERTKRVKDLFALLSETFVMDRIEEKIALWKLNNKYEIVSWSLDTYDNKSPLDDYKAPVSDLFGGQRNLCFIQMASNQMIPCKCADSSATLIFFKHYDAETDAITYFDCGRFQLFGSMKEVFDFLRMSVGLNNEADVKLYRNDVTASEIYESDFMVINVEGSGETFVFEIVDNGMQPKYVMRRNKNPSFDVNGNHNDSIVAQLPAESIWTRHGKKVLSTNVKIENMNGGGSLSKPFEKECELNEIRQHICKTFDKTLDQVELYDANRTRIDDDFLSHTFHDYIDQTHTKGRVTRNTTHQFFYQLN